MKRDMISKDILEKLGINLASAIAYLVAGALAFSRLGSSHEALAVEFHDYKSETTVKIDEMIDLLTRIQIEQGKQGVKINYIEETVE